MNWRDFAKKLRRVPKDLLASEVLIPDDASDSELVRAVVDHLPQLRQGIGIDEADLDRDVSLWKDLRAKRAAQAPLDAAASSADTKFKLVSELGSYPVNEALRRTGKIGADETIADVASDAAGGGTTGAAAGAVALALADPTNLVAPAKAGASKLTKMALTGLGATGMSVQAVQVLKVGQEYGFDSPEFKAALAGSAAGVGTAHAMGYRPGKPPAAAPPAAAPARVPERPLVVSGPLQGIPQPAYAPVTSKAGAMAPVALRPKDLIALKQAEAYSRMRAEKLLENARAEQKGVGVFEGLPDPPPRATDPDVVRAEIEAMLKAQKAPKGPKGRKGRSGDGMREVLPGEARPVVEAAPLEAPAAPRSIEEVRAEVDNLLAQDLTNVDAMAPPKRPSIVDVPRKYDPGLEADDLDTLDNGIRALEADIETSKSARNAFSLFERLKGGKRKVMDPMTKKEKLKTVKGQVHIADYLDMDPDRTLTPAEGRKAMQEIPKEYQSMFRYTGERDIGFHRLGERLNQKGFFGSSMDKEGLGLDNTHRLDDLVRAELDRVMAGETVFSKFDNDESGAIAGKEAQARLDAVMEATGVRNKKELLAALKARDGNEIELAFNRYAIDKDPWSIGEQKWRKAEEAMAADRDERFALENETEDAGLPPEPDPWGHASVKRRPKPKPASAPAARRDFGMIPGITPGQVAAMNKNILADPTISTWDSPGKPSADVAELEALIRQHGPNSPEFKAAVAAQAARRAAGAAGAPPGQPPKGQPPAAPSAPQGGGRPPEILLENPKTGKEGMIRRAFDVVRSWARTEKSALTRAGLMNTAEVVTNMGDRAHASIQLAEKFAVAQKALGMTKADVDALAKYVEGGRKSLPAGARGEIVKKMDAIFGPELDRTMEISTKLDPLNTAPYVADYFPRTAARSEAVPPAFSPEQLLKPLDQEAGTYRAPSLTKQRAGVDPEFSTPINDPEKLAQVLRSRARHAGLLEGGATKDRTKDSYPLMWGKLLEHEVSKLRLKKGERPSAKQMAGAEERAKAKLEGIQLPDLYEAAVKDLPDKTWEQINSTEALVKAANAIVRGRDAMSPWARSVTNGILSATSFAQLGAAAALNLLGSIHISSYAMDAAKAQGKGSLGQAAAGTGAMIKTLGLSAKYGAEDIAAAIKRLNGDRLASSPSREEFGASGQTWNIPRRAVVVVDRNVRRAFADVLEKMVPHLPPEKFALIDRSLPLTDPKNLAIIRREASGVSQGAGTPIDRLQPIYGGGPADIANILRELALQYSAPTMRQLEKALPMLLESPLKTAVGLGVGAQIAGELVADTRALQAGTGLNVPGMTEETEDQKNARKSAVGFAKAVLSKDRSPNPAMRALQNFVIAVPGGRELFMAAAYGDSPFEFAVSGTPAGGFAKTVIKAGKVGLETGDWRTVLSLANMPGLGPEWLKIVLLEHAQEKAKAKGNKNWRDVGIGQMPENLGIPGKIWLVAEGEITAEEAMRDTVGGKPLKFEEKVRKHHAATAEKKKKSDEAEERRKAWLRRKAESKKKETTQ